MPWRSPLCEGAGWVVPSRGAVSAIGPEICVLVSRPRGASQGSGVGGRGGLGGLLGKPSAARAAGLVARRGGGLYMTVAVSLTEPNLVGLSRYAVTCLRAVRAVLRAEPGSTWRSRRNSARSARHNNAQPALPVRCHQRPRLASPSLLCPFLPQPKAQVFRRQGYQLKQGKGSGRGCQRLS